MVGLAINYGSFKMATLGDADWSRELELACPVNKLGRINLYTINRHGSLDNSGAPALLGAIQPQVIVVNNGPRKGLGQKVDVKYITRQGETPAAYELNSYMRLAKLPGVEGIWQGHRSLLDADAAHNTTPDMIANLEEGAADQGYTITASVSADGTFTITNSLNGFARTYRARLHGEGGWGGKGPPFFSFQHFLPVPPFSPLPPLQPSEVELHTEFHEPGDQDLGWPLPIAERVVLQQHRARVERVVEVDVRACARASESQEFREAEVDLVQPLTMNLP
jgi:hypothetical protein